MTQLKAKQELFCQRFVQHANAAVAARAAGYSPRSARTAGHRLLRRPEVLARIAAIQIELARYAGRDLEAMIGKLEVVYRRSVETHQFAAAARAIELQAKLSLLVHRDESLQEMATRVLPAARAHPALPSDGDRLPSPPPRLQLHAPPAPTRAIADGPSGGGVCPAVERPFNLEEVEQDAGDEQADADPVGGRVV